MYEKFQKEISAFLREAEANGDNGRSVALSLLNSGIANHMSADKFEEFFLFFERTKVGGQNV